MLKRVLAVLLSLSLASPAWAAITFDAASSAEGTTSTSHSHTFAANANIAIICTGIRENGQGAAEASSVTVDGAAATFLSGSGASPDNIIRNGIWYKLAPTTGTVTVAVTGATGTDFLVTGVMSFIGVAQSSTFNTVGTLAGTGTNVNINSLASAVGEMGVMCGANLSEVFTVAPDPGTPVSVEQFERHHATSTSLTGYGYTEDGAATSINMQADVSSSVNLAAAAVSMRPLGSGVASRRRF